MVRFIVLVVIISLTAEKSYGIKFKLENDPKCGIPTGGKAECYFDCRIYSSEEGSGQLIENLECLKDCFSKDKNANDYCISSLLNDVINKGVCNLTVDGYNPGPGIYPETECGMGIVESPWGYNETVIRNGTCSEETDKLLLNKTCLREIMEEQGFIQNTLQQLILNSCSHEVGQLYINFRQEGLPGARKKRNAENEYLHSRIKRFAPAQTIYGSHNISTKLNFENTKNRYSWVCSLRSSGSTEEHVCAVNILSIPPKPTVIVGAAHCTFLCKNEKRQVPSCCCTEGPANCAENTTRCGKKPRVRAMTGADAKIVCGEWQTNKDEKRENVFKIKKIIRHSDFKSVGGNDIALFMIKKTPRNKFRDVNPACLPSKSNLGHKTGIHTGWSQPPPITFIRKHAKEYEEFYDNFFKEWHYKMDILEKCEDPKVTAISGGLLTYPSNSSYPAGTICAKDFSKQSCFSTGDSGSPLMVMEGDTARFSMEGILSFVKGCDVFTFGTTDSEKGNAQLNQQTENPAVYTKLSCFLPWIAEQYNMEYEDTDSQDPACLVGSGNPNDGDEPCRITPSNLIELFTGEPECIFPFYYKNKKYDGCILFEEDDFIYPVFRCPTRNITTKYEDTGINSFEFLPLVDGYCPDDFMDTNSPLNPNKTDCSAFSRRPPFSQCKNNCPGVHAFGLLGGGGVQIEQEEKQCEIVNILCKKQKEKLGKNTRVCKMANRICKVDGQDCRMVKQVCKMFPKSKLCGTVQMC